MVNRDDVNWDTVSYVISSEVRLKVLIHLIRNASTPTNLSEKLSEPMSRISTTLRELMEIGAIESLTPERRKGKIYQATEKGKKIIEVIHNMTDIR